MRCPTLAELPPPPEGKTGWPWTEETPQLPDVMPDGKPWPKISIVTPSFNQGGFIEETIRSVLLQGYPNLEYIILDGGSTDNTLEIVEKYDKYIYYWISEPDDGQADAIHRGVEMSTGIINAYINSDDYYCPNTFYKVAESFSQSPQFCWLTGRTVFSDTFGNAINNQPKYLPLNLFTLVYLGNFITQPSTFWKKSLYDSVGGINTSLKFCLDIDLFLKFLVVKKPLWIGEDLAVFRLHSLSKTSNLQEVCVAEGRIIRTKYISSDGYIRRLTGSIIGGLFKRFFQTGLRQ